MPPDDRDLRLARQLDAGEASDGSDALRHALESARPAAPSVEAGTSERLWAGIEAQMGPAPRAARPPLRLVQRPVVRWAAAALVLLAFGVAVWTTQQPDLVAVAVAETVTWDAPDGSTVTLRPNSRLVHHGERAYGLDGQAFFAVTSDPDRPFTVEAGPGTVRVLGTRFDVSTWGGETAVFVEEGRVAVEGASAEVVLGAGGAAAASSAGVARVEAPSAETYLDWQRGEVAFERERVQRVADEIGQHFDVRVAVGAAADETVSGVIRLDDVRQALGDLGRILGGGFEADGDGYRFVRP
ncbi:MAG: FecR domain-containing protein [Bacteroidota bacterium]